MNQHLVSKIVHDRSLLSPNTEMMIVNAFKEMT